MRIKTEQKLERLSDQLLDCQFGSPNETKIMSKMERIKFRLFYPDKKLWFMYPWFKTQDYMVTGLWELAEVFTGDDFLEMEVDYWRERSGVNWQIV